MGDREIIRVGVCGMGFMGDRHARAYAAAAADGLPVTLTAVADPAGGGGGGGGNLGTGAEGPAYDHARTAVHRSGEAMLDAGGVDLVSVCTPTDTHTALARRALEAGAHVLIEKPVALDAGPIRELAAVAAAVGRLAMPAMCMRFWPGWSWLKAASDSGRYGRILSARFERVGAAPSWSPAFYLDEARSGGALFDLHVHDADFVMFLFGPPDAVLSVGSRDHLTTTYVYPSDGPHVVAEGGWLASPEAAFRMRYLVEFEAGVAEFDHLRDPPLRLHAPGEPETPELDGSTGYDGQVRALIEAIVRRSAHPPATLAEAADVIDLLHAELRSLCTGRATPVAGGRG